MKWIARLVFVIIAIVVLVLYLTGQITELPMEFVIGMVVLVLVVFFIIGLREGRGK